MRAVGAVREPLAVLFGLLAFVCAGGATWQAGLAWPAAAGRPWARVAAAFAVAFGALGFSLGYWEVLSGIGDIFVRFDTATTRFLFDMAAVGLPFAAAGLLLGVVSTLKAADVPAPAIVPSILAGYGVGWLVDPFGTLAGQRMNDVRARYAASLVPITPALQPQQVAGIRAVSLFDGLGEGLGSGGGHGGGGGAAGGDGGGGGGGDGDGDPVGAAIALLVIALAVLAVAGGAITAALVFSAARKKAKAQLGRADRLRTAVEVASAG